MKFPEVKQRVFMFMYIQNYVKFNAYFLFTFLMKRTTSTWTQQNNPVNLHCLNKFHEHDLYLESDTESVMYWNTTYFSFK